MSELFTDVEVDASLYDTRFLHKVKRRRTLMDVLGHVDELVEIHLQTRARLVRANLAMADDMIAIARIAHRRLMASIKPALALYSASDQGLSSVPSCSIPIVYQLGFTSAFNSRHVGETMRPVCHARSLSPTY